MRSNRITLGGAPRRADSRTKSASAVTMLKLSFLAVSQIVSSAFHQRDQVASPVMNREKGPPASQQSYARYSRRKEASLGDFVFKLVSELQRGFDVIRSEFRIVAEDFGFRNTTPKPSEDVPDGDAGAAYDRLAGTNGGIHSHARGYEINRHHLDSNAGSRILERGQDFERDCEAEFRLK